jgi:outer membrane protein, adhesin transport system
MDRSLKHKASTGWILTSLLASVAMLVGQGALEAGTLEETIRAALATNPEIGVVREDRRAVDQELRQARALRMPQVDVRAAAGPEFTNSPTTRGRASRPAGGSSGTTLMRLESQLTLQQMLFDGFSTQSEIDRQTARVDSAAYRVQEAAEFIALNSVEAHLDVLRNEQLVELAADNIASHERILGQVSELERLGRIGIADVRQGESRFANSRQVLAVAEGNLLDARARYQAVVGQEASALLRPAPPVHELPASSQAAAMLASVHSPTVFIAASDVDVAQAEITGSRAGFYPRFDIEAGVGANENIDGVRGSNVGASALLVMRLNLFRGGADIAREREAFARFNEARQELARARRNAEEEARLSYNALTTARARTAALRDQVEAQRLTRDAYLSQFEVAQRTLLDVLDAENEYFITRSALVTAELTQEFAVYRVLAVAGRMLEALAIDQPPETISIWRGPDDVHTDQSIEGKTGPVRHPFEEPRPFRPSVEPPENGGGGGASAEPAEPAPAMAAAEEAGTRPAAPREYDSLGSFFGSLLGRDAPGDEAAPTAEAPAAGTPAAAADRETSGATPLTRTERAPAAPREYDSLQSFIGTVFGRDGSEASAEQVETRDVSVSELPAEGARTAD